MLQSRFPDVMFQYSEESVPFYSDEADEIIEKVRSEHENENMLSWLVFSKEETDREIHYAYRFSVRFKKHVSRMQWVNS